MIWTIVKKEIVSNLLTYKFFIIVFLIVMLISFSFYTMFRDYKIRVVDYHLIKPKPGEAIALISPNPLSIFVKGLDEAMSRSFELSVSGIMVYSGQKSGNFIFSFFPVPDFLYIVKVVLSLVALLLGFDQINREKERGTLGLMLSNPFSRTEVLLGKWVGNFLSIAVPFLITTVLGIVLLNLDPVIHFNSDNLGRLVFILSISLIYIALFLSLGILISTMTNRSAASIVILLFFWVIVVFLIPNLGTLLARQILDLPSVNALSERKSQIWAKEELLAQIEGAKAGSPEEAFSITSAHYIKMNSEIDKLYEEYRTKFNRLITLSKNINRISPVASFVYAASEIAGTGIGEESHLKDEVIKYKNQIFADILSAAQKKETKEYPAFNFRYRSFPDVLIRGALFDAAWMLFFNIFFFVMSYFYFVKYDVRQKPE